MPELDQKTVDELTGFVETMRSQNDKLKAGVITEAEFKEFQVKLDADRKAYEEKLEAKVNAPKPPFDSNVEIKAALRHWLATGEVKADGGLTHAEMKTMTVTDSTTGGIFAPPETIEGIITSVRELSPIRQLATVRGTSANMIQKAKKTGVTSGGWVTEIGASSESSYPAFAWEKIAVNDAAAWYLISRNDIDDPAFDIEADMRQDFATTFAQLESTAFVSGNGVGKPEGILTNTSVSATQTSGHATTIPDFDCIRSLQSALLEPYQANATWVMARATKLALELLTDGMGRYLWHIDYSSGAGDMLFGKPVVLATDMPAIGAGLKPIVYGDFRTAYTIADRMSVAFLRDEFTQAASRIVKIYAHMRVGGGVVQPEALKILTVGA